MKSLDDRTSQIQSSTNVPTSSNSNSSAKSVQRVYSSSDDLIRNEDKDRDGSIETRSSKQPSQPSGPQETEVENQEAGDNQHQEDEAGVETFGDGDVWRP
jgi:hypothetical protein